MFWVRVLGELELELDGALLELPTSRRARSVLGLLALDRRLHPRSELAARFWPDVLDASARTSLRSALAAVRRALGPAADAYLFATRDRAGLAPGVRTDAQEFEALVAGGRFVEAMDLWRGELLSGLDDDWVLVARDEWRDRGIAALAHLVSAAEARGEVGAAVGYARRMVAMDPLGEETQRTLMRLLVAGGNRAAALASYQRYADRLRAELRVAPSAATRALAEELRQPDEVTDMAAVVTASVAHEERPAIGSSAAGATAGQPLPALPAELARDDGLLVGRESELGVLRGAWREARAGAGRVVAVAGEAGIGKTRLMAELCRHAHTEGAAVWLGRCTEETLAPYQPFVEALRRRFATAPPSPGLRRDLLARLVPELGKSEARSPEPEVHNDGEGERLALFEAVAGLLREAARERPTVFVLEDLHWADGPALLLLRHIARTALDAPLLVLGTYRDVELRSDEPLAAALAELRRGRALTTVALGGLSHDEVEELIRGYGSTLRADQVRAVAERTEGNPFFVEEVLRQLERGGDRGVPETVKDLLLRRLRRLDAAVRDALAAAAVLGSAFELAALERITGADEEALLDAMDAALAEHVIVERAGTPGHYAFAHILIREAIYGQLSSGRRARLHARAGEALSDLYADAADDHAAELAHHFLRAGDDVRAFEHQLRAARAAMRALASEAAIAHYGSALEAATRLGLAARGDERVRALFLERGWLQHARGDFEAAIADFGRALEAARSVGDRRAEAEALDRIGYAEKLFDVERAREHHLDALAIARELADVPLQVRVLNRLSLVHCNQLDLAGALQAAERAEALARDGGGDAERVLAVDALKLVALHLGDLDRLEQLTAELAAFERGNGDLWYLQWTLLEAAFVPLARCRWEAARSQLDDALAVSRRVGDPLARPLIHDAACWLERSRGRYERALAEGRRAAELAAPGGGGPWSAWTRATLGWCLLDARAVVEAISVLEQGVSQAELVADRFRAAAHLAWAHTLAGDRPGAERATAEAESARVCLTLPAGGAYLFGFAATVAIARALLAAGRIDEAQAELEPLAAAARVAGWHEASASASLALGLCHAARGDGARARDALTAAAQVASQHGLAGVEWEALAALADASDGAEAGRHRRRSAAIARRLAERVGDETLAAGLVRATQG